MNVDNIIRIWHRNTLHSYIMSHPVEKSGHSVNLYSVRGRY